MACESERISKMFADLYAGNPWIEVTITDTLKNLTAEKVYKRPAQGINSIWEIVNHLINWRVTILKRLQGETIPSPPNNYFEPVKDKSAESWEATLKRLSETQSGWDELLSNMKQDKYDEHYPNYGYSVCEFINGILQHDAYHLGQIVLIKKLIA